MDVINLIRNGTSSPMTSSTSDMNPDLLQGPVEVSAGPPNDRRTTRPTYHLSLLLVSCRQQDGGHALRREETHPNAKGAGGDADRVSSQ